MAKSKKVQDTKKEQEELGKLLVALSEIGARDKKALYRIAFWKGVWSGLGGVLGATIVVALLLWVFSLLGDIPLLGPIIDMVREKIASQCNKTLRVRAYIWSMKSFRTVY